MIDLIDPGTNCVASCSPCSVASYSAFRHESEELESRWTRTSSPDDIQISIVFILSTENTLRYTAHI